jgi:hypothetical protein
LLGFVGRNQRGHFACPLCRENLRQPRTSLWCAGKIATSSWIVLRAEVPAPHVYHFDGVRGTGGKTYIEIESFDQIGLIHSITKESFDQQSWIQKSHGQTDRSGAFVHWRLFGFPQVFHTLELSKRGVGHLRLC